MARMRKMWAEFKAIAIGGTVLDLALGFIIGTAFATLIQSFVSNIFLQFVAVFMGKRGDFKDVKPTVNDTPINVGLFLNDVLQFVLLAVALFVIVKIITFLGVERGRTFELRSCPFCLDRVPRGAYICRACGQQLVEELPELAEAERHLAEREARRWPSLRSLPPLPPMPRRRRPHTEPADDAPVSRPLDESPPSRES
jgi:large conductance mechanosensitive channel